MGKSLFFWTILSLSIIFSSPSFSFEENLNDLQIKIYGAMVTPKINKETRIKKISKNQNNSNRNSEDFNSRHGLSNDKISFDKFKSILLNASFPKSSIHKMWCIAKNESSFNPLATNYNANGTFDVGLFQINQTWKRWCHMKDKDLLDVNNNARCALFVLKKQGYFAWVTFRKFCI